MIGTFEPRANSHPTKATENARAKPLNAEEDSHTETEDEDDDDVEDDESPVGWAYVGSHNFTPSAWGTLSGTGFSPVLNVSYAYYHGMCDLI